MAGETVLVIEDNELNVELVRELLELEKYEVLEAMDAETGIQLARNHQPDLVLMDIQLPGMDGLSATRIIKEDSALKDIPVVAFTSYAMQGDDHEAMEAGCNGYISKPINIQNFLKTVSQFITNERSKRQSQEEEDTRYKTRILIVDDDQMNVELLAEKLLNEKYEVLKAYSGEEALEKTNTTPPDLILLDIMMPGMDGHEVIRRLKDDPNTAHIPIVLVTSLDDSQEKVKGLEAGAEDFLTKPVNTTELLTRISSLLRLKQYREQLGIRTQSEEHFEVKAPQERQPKEIKMLQRVLVVEDDEKDIELIQNLLEGQPYHVSVARTGEEGISLALKEKTDLILLDILLPGIDGFEVCHRLKERDETKDIQIVVITCLSDLESKIKGVEQGVDDFLIKPINSREIRARIKVLLKKKEYLDKFRSYYETAFDSAITDGLTGLRNHAYFKRFLELELKRSARQGYSTALIMLDLDDFKKHNDTLGHQSGDIILRELAHEIKGNIREIDFAARYGGKKFAVVLPYSDRKAALTVTERIRKAMSSHIFAHESSLPVVNITASMGVALFPSDGSTIKELIQKADARLYQAKKEGKNRACISDKGVEDQAHQDIAI